MQRRPALQRLGSWLARLRGTDAPVGPAPVPAARSVRDGVPPGPLVAPAPDVAGTAEGATSPPPAPLGPHHQQGLRMAAAHRWNWAQRELEQAARAAVPGPATADLASVRAVRRQLRVLQKWPRDVPAHLALGRGYFELGLGADAEATFRRVLALAPDEPAAPYFLALEYAFRGEWRAAEDYYARARALAPDLPPFATWQDALGTAGGDATER